jgi:TolB protein
LALYVFDGEEEPSRILYNRTGSAPFYIYWSPDSHSITFLTQEASSLAMRLADADDPDADRVMAQGSPFYWAWSPDGDQVFMHVGGARVFSKDAHLSLLGNQEGSPRIQLKFPPGQFQAPVWSASGDSVLYIGSNDVGMDAIYRTDMTTSRQTLVTAVSGPACMVLAPDDGHIAYLEARSAHQLPALGSAYIIDKEGERKRRVFNGGVAAMYWSPDGKKLALLTLTQGDEGPTARAHGLAAGLAQPVRYRWWVYDIEEETIQLLTSFVPTQEFMQTVPYFDQYHLSLTFWSPDGRYFVVTKRTAGARDGSVWVLDSTGQESPRQVGEGTFAVWSWQ